MMELVLEHDEIETLLLEALKGRGIGMPADSKIRLRRNNKKGTLRVVFITPAEEVAPFPWPGDKPNG